MQLQTIKNHWKLLTAIFVITVILAGLFWYLWENHNIIINKEYRLKKTVMRYSELIEIGQFEEVFNTYLTPDAKARTTPGRKEIPMTEEERQAEKERFSKCNALRAIDNYICELGARHKPRFEDIQIPAKEIFERYAKERKDNWTNIQIDKIIYPNSNRADVRLKVTDRKHPDTAPIETWYLINGNWLRDF